MVLSSSHVRPAIDTMVVATITGEPPATGTFWISLSS
jgi:hypothetical protein